MKVMITQLKPVTSGRWYAIIGKAGEISNFLRSNKKPPARKIRKGGVISEKRSRAVQSVL